MRSRAAWHRLVGRAGVRYDLGTGVIGGAAEMLDAGARMGYAKATGTRSGGLFGIIGQGADDVQAGLSGFTRMGCSCKLPLWAVPRRRWAC